MIIDQYDHGYFPDDENIDQDFVRYALGCAHDFYEGIIEQVETNVWLSVDEYEPKAGVFYWHTHIKRDGTFTPVFRGCYNPAFKKMMVGVNDLAFTHFMESMPPNPPINTTV